MIHHEAWYLEAVGLPSVGYHWTSEDRWRHIQKKGLRVGSDLAFTTTQGSRWGYWYPNGELPIFLASGDIINPDYTPGPGEVFLKVDLRGVSPGAFQPDYASVIELHDSIEVQEDFQTRSLKWTYSVPEPLDRFAKQDFVLWKDDPYTDDDSEESGGYDTYTVSFKKITRPLLLACIAVSGTFGIVANFSPDKIERV